MLLCLGNCEMMAGTAVHQLRDSFGVVLLRIDERRGKQGSGQ